MQLVPIATLSGHTDIIRDMVHVPACDYLVTASLDKSIRVWEIGDTPKLVSVRNQHKLGIRAMAYSALADVLVTAGFDVYIQCWGLNIGNGVPIFRLFGHQKPVVSVACLTTRPEAITVDETGLFKVWNLRRAASIIESERCLQTFYTAEFTLGGIPYAPRRISTVSVDPEAILVAGSRFKAFQLKRAIADAGPPSALVYSEHLFSFYVGSGSDIRVRPAAFWRAPAPPL